MRRAVTAAIWGMPIVSVYAMRQAFFRDAKANYNDIVFWSKFSDWKNQTTTPNSSTHYVYFNFNTKEGPKKPPFEKTWKLPDIERVQ